MILAWASPFNIYGVTEKCSNNMNNKYNVCNMLKIIKLFI